MMSKLIVRARSGVKVPLELQPGKFIDEKAQSVPNSAYYRRRIIDGDLEVLQFVADTKPVKQNK
jgi:hypothetical protein